VLLLLPGHYERRHRRRGEAQSEAKRNQGKEREMGMGRNVSAERRDKQCGNPGLKRRASEEQGGAARRSRGGHLSRAPLGHPRPPRACGPEGPIWPLRACSWLRGRISAAPHCWIADIAYIRRPERASFTCGFFIT
jgi:hypothetical protein